MRPIQALRALTISPILQVSACRVVPLFQQRDLYSQCSAYSTSTSSQGFSYRIAASFSAKGNSFNPKTDLFSYVPFSGTLPKKIISGQRSRSGQDAFFVNNIGNSSHVAFGVADGVGGWSDSGIDSAFLSHGLCEYMREIAEKTGGPSAEKLKARELLQKGYEGVLADESIAGGGTTACVAVGHEDGGFEVANLGDSGFVQLRPNAIHFYSNPQIHAFNTPYQLSIIPPKILARSRIFGGEPLRDLPNNASVTHHEVRHGDVLVFATDGVWDNLSSTDLLKVVSRYMTGFGGWEAGSEGLVASGQLNNLTLKGGIAKEHERSLQSLLAVAITGEAKMASLNTKIDGPFAREVQKHYPRENFHGGKVDDICVIVALVVGNEK